MSGMVEAARVLLEAEADVNKRTSDGRTPLFLALEVSDWESEHSKQAKLEVATLRSPGA